MSEKVEQDLLNLFDEKFKDQSRMINRFIAAMLSITGIFAVLFISFMIGSSRNEGVQDANIASLTTLANKNCSTIEKMLEYNGGQKTKDAVFEERLNSLLGVIENTNAMAKRTEYAVLTGDKSVIRDGLKE